MLSFAYQPNSYDLIVSEFTLHHLPDFWKAVALARIFAALKPGANFYLRDIVFVSTPDGEERSIEQWADFSIKNHDFDRDSAMLWQSRQSLLDAAAATEKMSAASP